MSSSRTFLGALNYYGTRQIADPTEATEVSLLWKQPGTTLPEAPSSLTADETAAFWFILYGPQTISGAAAGPQGAQGEIGVKGSQGTIGTLGSQGGRGTFIMFRNLCMVPKLSLKTVRCTILYDIF